MEYYLAHHGIKGQKWGIRRYQNEDGTLTAEGRERYGYKPINKKEASNLRKQYWNTKITLNPFAHAPQSPDSHDNRIVNNAIKIIKDSGEEEDNLLKKMQNTLDKDTEKYFNDKKTIKTFIDYMRSEFGGPDKVDDPDIAWLAINDFLEDESIRVAFTNPEFKKSYQELNKLKETKSKVASKYIEDSLGKYGDQPIMNLTLRPSVLGGVGMTYTKSTLKEGIKQDVNKALAKLDVDKSIVYYDDDLITKYTNIWNNS